MAKTPQQILQESTNAAQIAAQSIGGTFEQGVGFSGGNIAPTPSSVGASPTTGASVSDQFLAELKKKLLGESGIVSSQGSAITNAYDTAVSGLQGAQEDVAKGITAHCQRLKEAAGETG